jgi:hypothetical protein
VIESLQAHNEHSSPQFLRLHFESFMIGPTPPSTGSWSAGGSFCLPNASAQRPAQPVR